jgi:hypothetical protein
MIQTHSSADQQMINEGYAEGKKSFEYLSKEIHEQFNWERLHKAMTSVNWCWALGTDSFGKCNMGVPSIETIKNQAYALLKQAYDEEKQISTGGFSAGWDSGELFLVFTLGEASAR